MIVPPLLNLLLLLLVKLVTAVLRHKHHLTAKKEVSHTTSQTSHPAVSQCEETEQAQYASLLEQDSHSHIYTSAQPHLYERVDKEEMGGYSEISQHKNTEK